MLDERAKLAAHARPAGTGAITGTVAGFDGQLVAGACVTAVSPTGSVTAAAAPDGIFRLAGLAAGRYALEYRDCAAPGRYLATWSGGVSAKSAAARMQVVSGQVRQVPVMVLRPANPVAAQAAAQASFRRALAANGRHLTTAAAAKTGRVSGRVTGKGKALRGICVQVFPASGNGEFYGAVTGKHGTYSVQSITPGRYRVIFASQLCQSSTNWLQQVYKNDNGPFALFDGSGKVIKVRAGHKIAGINASLRLGGVISGTVTSKSGRKLRGICIQTDGQVTGGYIGLETQTSANGSYHLHALFPGKYPVYFSIGCGSGGSNYAPASHRAVKVRLGERLTLNAALASGASITGKVTLGSGSGSALRGICVSASNPSGSVSDYSSTDRKGDYRVIGLTSGRYQLQFSPGCNNQGNYTTTFATVHTKAAHRTAGVNAVLLPGAVISGVVTDSHGNPISGICIELDGNNSYTANVPESTGDDGSYAITGLSAGTYEVGFAGGCGNSGNYAPTWYQNQSDESQATPITLTTGGAAVANEQMLPGATITGRVTNASGHRLSGICVYAATTDQAELGAVFTQDAVTQNGSYTIAGLAPGQYLVDFSCGLSSKYADQWFPGAPDAGSADLISASAGRTSGINAVLRPGGSIRGVVTNQAGHPLADVCVTAAITQSAASEFGGAVGNAQPVTGQHGSYRISGLTPGRYYVSFTPCSTGTQRYAPQWYRGASSMTSATAVKVQAGKTTSGIDGRLIVGGTMSGRVVTASGKPVRNICVFAFSNAEAIGGAGSTGKTGTYSIKGLDSGRYVVEFFPCYNQNYVAVLAHARVTAPHATTGVDATMHPGGSIAGVVTEGSASGPPVSDLCVEVDSSNPNNLGSFASTGSDGSYLATGLAAGSYQVYFDTQCLFTGSGDLAPQWYNDAQTQAAATPVTVKVGQTTPSINAALQPNGDGEISGTVSAAGPSPTALTGACVTAIPLPAGSAQPVVAVSRPSGYRLPDLFPGRYKVRFSAGCGAAGYATQWWRDKTSQKTATVITVGVGQDVSGISATLGKSS